MSRLTCQGEVGVQICPKKASETRTCGSPGLWGIGCLRRGGPVVKTGLDIKRQPMIYFVTIPNRGIRNANRLFRAWTGRGNDSKGKESAT
jgi:hypothetical protein